MSDDPSIPPAFLAHLETMGIEADTMEFEATATLGVPSPDLVEPTRWLEQKVPVLLSGEGDLRLQGRLGEGGMGLVHLALQVSLDRQVAVKSPREAKDTVVQALLREAVVTGQLEHPNIIPVYALGQNDEGMPHIVMKRIDGLSWADILAEPSLAPDGPADLAWHLRILLQVCNALMYSHDHGIVHRDIKPENVMIGRFGEVYLLDWGLALAFDDEHRIALLPPREAQRGTAGTPGYMAPEMTEDTAASIDERTDVYLLGATLHELIMGTPRHQGRSLVEMLFRAHLSAPFDYPPSVDPELAAIANRATAKDPHDRYPNVASLRGALVAYLDHRAASEIARAAMQRAESVRAALEEGRSEAEVGNLLTEARFGLAQSLSLWPENEGACDALQNLLEAVIRHRLDRGDAAGAATLLAELPRPNAELQAELEEIRRRSSRRSAELEKLKRLEQDVDIGVGARQRAAFILGIGFFWAVVTVVGGIQQWGADYDNREMLAHHLASFPVVLGTAVVMIVLLRRYLFANQINTRLMFLLGGCLLTMAIMRVLAWFTQMDAGHTFSFELIMLGLGAVAVGALADLRLGYVGAPLYFAAGIGSAFFPEYRLFLLAAATQLFFIAMAVMWWNVHSKPEAAKETQSNGDGEPET